MTDFSTGKKVQSFADGLQDTFPFFRAFLDDADDAELTYFISTKEADVASLQRIEKALDSALTRIVGKYPNMVPPSIEITKGYENEGVLGQAVARLIQMLIHLKGCISAFGKVIELGGDPKHL
ncbi:MAG: hypothetical protein E6Q68_07465 [Polynucleobacter sp.]|nr:MAG: hypothetical protein E6Q68_07465 [Polynucleobacter sp.]